MARARKDLKPSPTPNVDRTSTAVVTPRARHTVLLVEDETMVRKLLARLLASQGFEVLAAADGHEALTLWQEHGPSIDLLLTDVVMPEGMSGRALAEVCSEQKPGLKVVYMSGYNMELSDRDGHLRVGINYVQKPYRTDQLFSVIRSVLNLDDKTNAHHSTR